MLKRILIALIAFLLLTSLASAATLQVGPKLHYKTIQNAVNDAHTGDTILVTAGTYKEKVIVNDKDLFFQGAKVNGKYVYPSVYGFEFGWSENGVGSGDVNGFKITKYGISYDVAGGNTVRNNYFTNCWVGFGGSTCSNNKIINNQFTNGGISFSPDSWGNEATGNRITKSPVGIEMYDADCHYYKNTITYCKIGVYRHDSVGSRTVNFVGKKDKSGYYKDKEGNLFKGNKIDIQEYTV